MAQLSGQRPGWLGRWSVAIVAGMCAIVLLACAVALWLVDAAGRTQITEQERETASIEMDLLQQIQAEEGDGVLVQSVARLAQLEGSHYVYALKTGDGAILAGDLRNWPAELGDAAPWQAVAAEGFSMDAASRRLENGLVLMVGRDQSALARFQGEVFDAVWLAVALVAITCILAGVAATTFMLSRVRSLSDVAARVSAGDFSARAKDAGNSGPFGQIAQAQNLMLDRIEDLVSGLRTVTDSLAHDLRTPLASLRRHIEAGLLTESAAEKQAALESALLDANRTIATFTALIDIARADGGLSRDAMTDVDLDALVQDVHSLFQPMAEDKGQTLTLHSLPARLAGHKPLLMQAISNLVHNAIKYAPEGGKVEISVKDLPDAVEVAVSDDGPGIPENKREEALQRFHRVAAGGEGLGLGLAIVEACARLHRGKLVLEDASPGLRATLVLSKAA